MHDTLRYEAADGVGTLTLHRPGSRNAIDLQLRRELRDLFETLRQDPSLRALVLTGAGGHFCAGGDLASMSPPVGGEPASAEQRRQRLVDLQPLVQAMVQFDRPVIAAVRGVAYGAGLGLALTADFVLAGDDARFCAAFGRVGAIPDFATLYSLPRAVGLQRAKELVYSAREVGAQEAVRLGLALEMHPAGEVLARAQAFATRLTQASPAVLSMSKRALGVSLHTGLQTMLMLESDGQGVALASNYHVEALRRFHAKEPAMLQWPLAASERETAGDHGSNRMVEVPQQSRG